MELARETLRDTVSVRTVELATVPYVACLLELRSRQSVRRTDLQVLAIRIAESTSRYGREKA